MKAQFVCHKMERPAFSWRQVWEIHLLVRTHCTQFRTSFFQPFCLWPDSSLNSSQFGIASVNIDGLRGSQLRSTMCILALCPLLAVSTIPIPAPLSSFFRDLYKVATTQRS